MHDIPFDVLAALGSLVYALNLFIDNLVGGEYASAWKQGKTWVVGVVIVLVAAHVQYTMGWTVNGLALHSLTLWSQLLLGLTGAAFANTGFHIFQRFDNNGSGNTPTVTPFGVRGRRRVNKAAKPMTKPVKKATV